MNTKEMITIMQAYEDGKQIRSRQKGIGLFAIDAHPIWDWCNVEYEVVEDLKPVDLSVLIDRGIDCEFSNDGVNWVVIGALGTINAVTQDGYIPERTFDTWKYCRPRMNHIHAWPGGECPLPEGIVVKVWYRDDAPYDGSEGFATRYRWSFRDGASSFSDIIAFEVIGLADGYCYPWECDE